MSAREKLTIETPELTPLEFPLAGIGSRFLALAFDTILQGVATLIAAAPVAVVAASVGTWNEGRNWAIAALVLVLFVIHHAYFAVFEAIWNGQTPGKRRLGLRVIKDSGRPIGVQDALARNLIRIVDEVPGLYAVGIASALLSGQNKRLGDYVAGTVVVRETGPGDPRPVWTGETTMSREIPSHRIGRLTDAELDLVDAFLARRDQLAEDLRWEMARSILERLAPKLELERGPWEDRERVLEMVAHRRRRIAGHR